MIVNDRGISFKAPDYQFINDSTSNPNSRYYYPRLLERLAKADTTLDINDLRCIYYGYALQPDFDPYGRFDEQKEIQDILFSDVEPSKADFEKVVSLANQALAKKPTELPMYYYCLIGCHYGYGQDDPRTINAHIRYEMMMDAVYSSGNGSHEAPFHLTTVMHSYFIMNMNDLNPEFQSLSQVNGRFCDVFPIAKNEYGIDTLYFDIHECFMHMSKMFESHDEASAEKAGTQLELPLGTHFIIKLEGDLDEEDTEFKVVKMEPFDTILPNYHDTGLFSTEGNPNTVEGFFCRANFGSSVKVVLIFKSWIEDMANFNTDIRQENGTWEETSNSGMLHKVEMTEIWSTSYDMLKISNIRKRE